jgi:Family of unknown function (DUF6404)
MRAEIRAFFESYPMTFEEKRDAALALVASTGMWRSHYAPPLYRVLWRMGIHVQPPHFAGFWFNVSVLGGFFGAFMCLFTTAAAWFSGRPWPLPGFLVAPVVAGLVFGLLLAGFVHVRARTYSLPPWSEVGG